MGDKIAVTLATLESHNHIVGDVERGVKLYERGGVEFAEDMNLGYIADIPEKNDIKRVKVQFTRDGRDVESFYCNKCSMRSNGAVCRHIVAAVLAVQGGIVETKLTLGKTASVTTTVTKAITAKAVGSGSLDVFATPMMIALMEKAACECLEDTLAAGQTSVGMQISVEHSAASLIDSKITATATVAYVFGRKIEFIITANDGMGEIGKGRHTRVIVDEERFMTKAR